MVSSRKKIFFFLAASFARQLIGDKLQVGACTALDAVDSAYRPFTLAFPVYQKFSCREIR
jgi:hypothetical protein